MGAAAAAGLQGQLAVLRQLWLTNIKAELKYGRRRYNMCQHRGVPTIHALAGGPFVRGVNSMLQVATDKAAYCSACTANMMQEAACTHSHTSTAQNVLGCHNTSSSCRMSGHRTKNRTTSTAAVAPHLSTSTTTRVLGYRRRGMTRHGARTNTCNRQEPTMRKEYQISAPCRSTSHEPAAAAPLARGCSAAAALKTQCALHDTAAFGSAHTHAARCCCPSCCVEGICN